MFFNNIEMSDFYCTQCGYKGLPVWRKMGACREAGHLKKLFCLNCGYETNHVECKPNTKYQVSDFEIEFKYGNFTSDGQRKYPYNKLKEMIKNGKIQPKEIMVNCGDSGTGQEHLDSET